MRIMILSIMIAISGTVMSQVRPCSVTAANYRTSYEILAEMQFEIVKSQKFSESWILEIFHFKCGSSEWLGMQSESGLYFYDYREKTFDDWKYSISPGEFYHTTFRDSKPISYYPNGLERQCEATTKSGEQCSRHQVESYCYQHG